MDALIRAAGGVLYRRSGDRVEIAVVHRPRLDDWSLPKGKRKRGEHAIVNAQREVWEETAVRPVVGVRLPSVAYPVTTADGDRADKSVDYWAMTCGHDDGFVAGDETDRLAWLAVADAAAQLSYERDIEVVRAFAALPPLRAPVVLVRHASAGEPREWSGPDDRRPLDQVGQARARALAPVLNCFAPVRLVSAAPLRCVDTLAPLAARTDLAVIVDHHFDEESDPRAAADRLVELAETSGASVVCSQGKLIAPLLAQLARGTAEAYRTAKGQGWVLSFGIDGTLVAADPLP